MSSSMLLMPLFSIRSGSYYDMLPERIEKSGIKSIDEDIEVLRELEILLDGEHHHAYMLQIFLKESSGLYKDPNAGPFFYEIIPVSYTHLTLPTNREV